MIKVDIAEATARFSRCLASVERAETVIACRRNVPIAGIARYPAPVLW